MFLLNEILWFLPLVFYSGFRVWRLIRRPLLKALFIVAFIAVLGGFPLAESLSHRSAAGAARPVMLAGYYCLPLLLYFVLFVVPADLLLGLARLTRLLSKDTIAKPRFRSARLGLYLLVPVVVVGLGIWNYDTIRIKHSTINVPRRSSTVPRFRIVFAADFHLGERTAARFMERFVDRVNAQNPDIVLFGGDMLEGDRRGEDAARFEAQFRRIRSKLGLYAVPGNHEGYAGGRTEFFERAGIRLLTDEVVRVDDTLTLAGRNDSRRRGRKAVADLLKDTPRDLPLIVLDHRPLDLDNISLAGADILLSGHTHHGQLFPVNFVTRDRYELDWGYKLKRQTHVFVTSGVQLWGPPVRTTGLSEILVIDVQLTSY